MPLAHVPILIPGRCAALLLLVLSTAGSAEPAQPEPPTETQTMSHMVLVRPFTVTGPGAPEWFGRSIAQALEGQAPAVGLMAAREPVFISPPRNPLRSLASRGIGILVEGACDSDGHTLRASGTIVNVASGELIGSLSATGGLADLPRIKDTLVAQLQAILAPAAPLPQPPMAVLAPPTPAPAPETMTPGAAFEQSRLAQSLEDPDSLQRDYGQLYSQRVTAARRYYPLGIPGFYYPRGYYYPPPVVYQPVAPIVVIQRQSTGVSFDASYRSSKWQIDISGGTSQ